VGHQLPQDRGGSPAVARSWWVASCPKIVVGRQLPQDRGGSPAVANSWWVTSCPEVVLAHQLSRSRRDSPTDPRSVVGHRLSQDQSWLISCPKIHCGHQPTQDRCGSTAVPRSSWGVQLSEAGGGSTAVPCGLVLVLVELLCARRPLRLPPFGFASLSSSVVHHSPVRCVDLLPCCPTVVLGFVAVCRRGVTSPSCPACRRPRSSTCTPGNRRCGKCAAAVGDLLTSPPAPRVGTTSLDFCPGVERTPQSLDLLWLSRSYGRAVAAGLPQAAGRTAEGRVRPWCSGLVRQTVLRASRTRAGSTTQVSIVLPLATPSATGAIPADRSDDPVVRELQQLLQH
jgi:hypothetical protein